MKRYSKEFREQSVKLSDDIGVKKACEQLGVPYGTVVEWRKSKNKVAQVTSLADTNSLSERERLLIKENKELKEANEILKDALGFFAKDRKQ